MGRFVSDPTNRLATAAARSVVERPGFGYNPLVVHGPTGCGKTHLLRGITLGLRTEHPGLRVRCLCARTLVEDVTTAARAGLLGDYQRRLSEAGALLVDNVQALEGREGSQQVLFHAFNHLVSSDRQVVLASSVAPERLVAFPDRLRTRLAGGLSVRMDAPSFEGRVAVLQRESEERWPQPVSRDVLALIATNEPLDMRALLGALVRLLGYASLRGEEPSIALLGEVTKGAPAVLRPRPRIEDVLDAVCRVFRVSIPALQSARRFRSLVPARQLAMAVLRQNTELTLEAIGGLFGGRDHSTVIHALRKTRTRIAGDPVFAARALEVERLAREESEHR